ncbi:MAG: TrkA family potassium uptake protein [Verrucomicrobia bacterium]|nr:TrkA family potassium uptake protein [Verrucomicrobiota bacterium]
MARRFLIIGVGRFGAQLASRLSEFGCDVLLADRDPDRVEDLVQDGFHAVEVDAEDQEALKEAGVQEADAVVVCIGDNMQGSILTTLLLKELKVRQLICRAVDAKHATVLEKLGADLVVLPNRDVANRLAERLRDNLGSDRQQLCGDYQLAQIRLSSALDGRALAEAGLRGRFHVNVVLLTRERPDGTIHSIEPDPNEVMRSGDILFVSGLRENLNRFERECGLSMGVKGNE